MTVSIGVSFHTRHAQDILTSRPDLSFFEVHCENYMSPGGLSRQLLREVCEVYPLSAHGVGLSLGSAEGLEKEHLADLKIFYQEFNPILVSEHLSWSRHKGAYLNDLLPVPYTHDALKVFENNINEAQETLQRTFLIENPSTYMTFRGNDFTETDFLGELCKRTGCGLLLDVNNIFVSCTNAGTDPVAYLHSVPKSVVGQYHLAGHTRFPDVYIDDHGSSVSDEVWSLYEQAVQTLGPQPTLVEWDDNVPDLQVLVSEAFKARDIMLKTQQQTETGYRHVHQYSA